MNSIEVQLNDLVPRNRKNSDQIAPVFIEPSWFKNSLKLSRNVSDSELSSSSEDTVEKTSVEVHGTDISDIPTSYEVCDLGVDEFPIIG